MCLKAVDRVWLVFHFGPVTPAAQCSCEMSFTESQQTAVIATRDGALGKRQKEESYHHVDEAQAVCTF